MILYENCERYTPEQRQALMQIPKDDWVLGTYYTFSKRDLEIINKPRSEENRLEYAVQLAVFRYPGWPYTHIKSIPDFEALKNTSLPFPKNVIADAGYGSEEEELEALIPYNTFLTEQKRSYKKDIRHASSI